VIRIDVPPLRERREDLLPLIDRLLERACERLGKPVAGISVGAVKLLMAHDWPGNVRELANTLERAVALSDHDTIVAEDLASTKLGDADGGDLRMAARAGLSLAELSRDYARRVLELHAGNKAAAARALDIDRRTLYRMVGSDEGEEPA
jgi:DNA-binding NtrC family response regulator